MHLTLELKIVLEKTMEHIAFMLWHPLENVSFLRKNGVVVIESGATFSFFNRIVFLKFEKDNLQIVLETMEAFRKKGLPFSFFCEKTACIPQVIRMIKRERMSFEASFTGMGIALDCLIRPEWEASLTLEPISFPQERTTWENILHKGAGFPIEAASFYRALQEKQPKANPFIHFIAYEGKNAMGCITLKKGEKIAEIYNVATLPSARGRGIGSTMVFKLLEYARRLGHTHAALLSTPMGYSVYSRLGFSECTNFRLYFSESFSK